MKITFSDTDELLIWLYLFIDSLFKQGELSLYTNRLSNNCFPFFTDAELLTCAIFSELMGHHTKKDGYKYMCRHYRSWFPKLPKYEVYNRKLNKFHDAFAYIFKQLRASYVCCREAKGQIDTAPIVVCHAQHSANAKAAQPFVSKGYCAAKKMYYVGAKLQIIAQNRNQALPIPIDYHLETASKHDLQIAKQTIRSAPVENMDIYADKAYIDNEFQMELFENHHINVITPHKKKKGQSRLTLFQQAFNTIHASARQPIDTLFGWIHDKTKIQNASKVRSVEGLFYFINIKMVAALIMLIFNF